jgi:hypothetical protein
MGSVPNESSCCGAGWNRHMHAPDCVGARVHYVEGPPMKTPVEMMDREALADLVLAAAQALPLLNRHQRGAEAARTRLRDAMDRANLLLNRRDK